MFSSFLASRIRSDNSVALQAFELICVNSDRGEYFGVVVDDHQSQRIEGYCAQRFW
jgi:hypothetical protein